MFYSVLQLSGMLQTLPTILQLCALSHKGKWGENVEPLKQGLQLDDSWAELGLHLVLYGSWAGFLGVQPVQSHRFLCLKASTLSLMLCSCHLEILNTFWSRDSAFSLYTGTGPWNFCSQSYMALLIYNIATQIWVSSLSLRIRWCGSLSKSWLPKIERYSPIHNDLSQSHPFIPTAAGWVFEFEPCGCLSLRPLLWNNSNKNYRA